MAFYSFINVTEISGLNILDTRNVTNMSNMFFNCPSLTTLDLSSFDTSDVTDMSGMFAYSDNLTTIYVSDSFNASNVTYGYTMFGDCTKLVGGNGTTYDTTKIDNTYARIDAVGTPGYFTSKD